MKTLKNHTILFDASCPMCRIYTKAFTQTGMLDQDGRASYQEMPAPVCPVVDTQRAVNEIALVNNETGEVVYGIQSLFKVLGNSFPFLGPLFRFKPFGWFMSKVYAFISYNRRVIVPPVNGDSFTVQPTFKLHYRLIYLVFTWLFTSLILSSYAALLNGLLPAGPWYREYLVCGGQVVFQGIVISLLSPEKKWNYLGNMMTISFAGSLLLLPGLAATQFAALSPVIYALYFLAVAGAMFLEHIRRMKLLQLGWLMTASWVIYRLLILLLIFQTHETV